MTTTNPPECTALETTCPGMFEDENFACSDGSTVPADWVCDGTDDCDGGEDEVGS